MGKLVTLGVTVGLPVVGVAICVVVVVATVGGGVVGVAVVNTGVGVLVVRVGLVGVGVVEVGVNVQKSVGVMSTVGLIGKNVRFLDKTAGPPGYKA